MEIRNHSLELQNQLNFNIGDNYIPIQSKDKKSKLLNRINREIQLLKNRISEGKNLEIQRVKRGEKMLNEVRFWKQLDNNDPNKSKFEYGWNVKYKGKIVKFSTNQNEKNQIFHFNTVEELQSQINSVYDYVSNISEFDDFFKQIDPIKETTKEVEMVVNE